MLDASEETVTSDEVSSARDRLRKETLAVYKLCQDRLNSGEKNLLEAWYWNIQAIKTVEEKTELHGSEGHKDLRIALGVSDRNWRRIKAVAREIKESEFEEIKALGENANGRVLSVSHLVKLCELSTRQQRRSILNKWKKSGWGYAELAANVEALTHFEPEDAEESEEAVAQLVDGKVGMTLLKGLSLKSRNIAKELKAVCVLDRDKVAAEDQKKFTEFSETLLPLMKIIKAEIDSFLTWYESGQVSKVDKVSLDMSALMDDVEEQDETVEPKPGKKVATKKAVKKALVKKGASKKSSTKKAAGKKAATKKAATKKKAASEAPKGRVLKKKPKAAAAKGKPAKTTTKKAAAPEGWASPDKADDAAAANLATGPSKRRRRGAKPK